MSAGRVNWRAVRAIVRRDLTVVRGSKAVVLPIVIVPLLMLVVLPVVGGILPRSAGPNDLAELRPLLDALPAGIAAGLPAPMAGKVAALVLVYLLAPMYLIVPLMVASVLAADSFAGEKERRTLEGLLNAPVTDRDLLLAKVLVAWLPAVVVGLIGAVLYGSVAEIAIRGVVDGHLFPNLVWVLLAVWVGPAVAGLGLSAMVLVSARVQSFQAAYQIGGVVVLPVVLLVVGQGAGVVAFDARLVAALGAVIWLIDGALLWYGARHFRREELALRL